MAKLSQGRPGSNDGCALLDRIRMIAAYCGCKTWNEAKHQGGKGNCPLCGGWKLSVGVGRESNVGVSCWSEKCRKDPQSRDKIVNRLVVAGFYLGPDQMIEPEASAAPEANGDQTQPAPARKRTRVRMRMPTVSADQVSGLTPAQRRALLWLSSLADSNGWVTTTRRKITAECHVSDRDAVSMLRRIQSEHKLIEVQKNSYAKKRATKVRFTVNRDDLVTALGGYPNAKAAAKAIAAIRRASSHRPDMSNGTTMNDGTTTPVNLVPTWNGDRHVLNIAIHRQPTGAVDASLGHWRNGGRKTVTKPGTSGRPVVHDDKIIVPAARPALERSSHRGGLHQGIHPSDHLNQASTAPTSDSEALPVERILQSAASARARPGAKPAHTYARETPIHGDDLFAAEAEAWFGYPPSAIASVDSADTPDTGTPEIGAPEARMPPAATPAPPTGPTAASWRDKAEITQPDNGRRRWAKS
jgi:hypothetical protein